MPPHARGRSVLVERKLGGQLAVVTIDAEEDGDQHGTMIQAPSLNLVTAKARVTNAVTVAPTRLVIILERQRGSWRSTEPCSCTSAPGGSRALYHQRRVMPAWESVNDMNTPMQ